MEDLANEAGRIEEIGQAGVAAIPDAALCVVYGDRIDDRGSLVAWDQREARCPQTVIRVYDESQHVCRAKCGAREWEVRLRSDREMADLFSCDEVRIDISVMPLRIWGPLVRSAMQKCGKVVILYTTPEEYQAHKAPTPTSTFDLSERVRGLEPIPGFAKLSEPEPERERLLVVLLGFEGARARYVSSVIDPMPRVVPLVGVPGMQLEYPTNVVACNKEFLEIAGAYSDVRVVDAVSPFGVVRLLEKLASVGQPYMYLAPLGTKAHALGCVLFAVNHWNDAELLYDHPVAKPGSTRGIGQIYSYSVKP